MRAGTVVRHLYKTLDGENKPGVFLIIYDERYDQGIIPNGNVLALKITSTSRELHYDVMLRKKFNNYLVHDSYVMCSKPHVLPKGDIEVLGRVTPIDLMNVYKTYKRFNTQIDEQIAIAFACSLQETKQVNLIPSSEQ